MDPGPFLAPGRRAPASRALDPVLGRTGPAEGWVHTATAPAS